MQLKPLSRARQKNKLDKNRGGVKSPRKNIKNKRGPIQPLDTTGAAKITWIGDYKKGEERNNLQQTSPRAILKGLCWQQSPGRGGGVGNACRKKKKLQAANKALKETNGKEPKRGMGIKGHVKNWGGAARGRGPG